MRSLAVAGILAAVAALPVSAQSLDERLSTCFACHGAEGTSQLPDIPSLGAQPAFYSLVQLVMFRDKLRVTEPMNQMTAGLSDDDLRKMIAPFWPSAANAEIKRETKDGVLEITLVKRPGTTSIFTRKAGMAKS